MALLPLLLAIAAQTNANPPKTFAGDVSFLRRYAPVVVLKKGQAEVVVVPKWQGRVMTSALNAQGPGFGWINYDFIKTRKLVPHMNVFGGEDRLWLGPEGGQFGLFFKKGSPFDLPHWQTPPPVDSLPFRVVGQTSSSVTVSKNATFTNYTGTKFHVRMLRTVSVMSPKQAMDVLDLQPMPGVKVVGYQSKNTITNEGRNTWNVTSGKVSIWILSQYICSPTTTVVAPYNPNGNGVVVNDTYFGKVPSDRLKTGDDAVFFKADGKYRSKIGINPSRSKGVIGSYDPGSGVITIIKFSQPQGVDSYVNSMWEIQKKPFGGDVVNSYNDGPPSPGAKPLGPFYEVESSSPAAGLKPGQSITHYHRTFHIEGPKDQLEKISQQVFGVGLDQITEAFGS